MRHRRSQNKRTAVEELGPIQLRAVNELSYLISRICAEPFDAIRVVQFVGSPLAGKSFLETTQNMYHTHGIAGFWTLFPIHLTQTWIGTRIGFRALVARLFVQWFPQYRRALWRHAVTSSMGQLLFALTSHPLETIRIRMRMVEGTPHQYANVFDCLLDMIEHDGLASLFAGMTCAPFGAIWSAFGRIFAGELVEYIEDRLGYKRNVFVTVIENIFMGLAGTTISQPLFLVQKKMMVSYENVRHRVKSDVPTVTPASSLTDTVLAVWDTQGLGGFWAGWLGNTIRHAIIGIVEESLIWSMTKLFKAFNFLVIMLRHPKKIPVILPDGIDDDDEYDSEEEEEDDGENDSDVTDSSGSESDSSGEEPEDMEAVHAQASYEDNTIGIHPHQLLHDDENSAE